jgi:hypothetical protein
MASPAAARANGFGFVIFVIGFSSLSSLVRLLRRGDFFEFRAAIVGSNF